MTLADQYLAAPHDWTPRTRKSARLRVLAFLRWCAAQRPAVETAADLTHDVLDAWKNSRREAVTRRGAQLTATTVARDWKAVRRMFSWARERGDLPPGPFPFLDRRAPREPRRVSAGEIPSPREIERVARALRKRQQRGAADALLSLLATGLRRTELRKLTPERVGDREVKPFGKGNKERLVPVSKETAATLRRYIEARDRTRPRGRQAVDEGVGLDDHWAARVLRPACEAAGVPPFGAHDVRRTFATECVRSRVDVLTVQRWLGHTSVATTQRYLGHYRDDAPVEPPTPRALRRGRR